MNGARDPHPAGGTSDDRPIAPEDGPIGHAPTTESGGDPDAGDVASGAEAGAIGGAVAGTGAAGPLGGFIGATLGGLAGAGAEAIDEPEASPGRVIREPYGHPVRVRDRRESGRDARGASPEEGAPGEEEIEPPA